MNTIKVDARAYARICPEIADYVLRKGYKTLEITGEGRIVKADSSEKVSALNRRISKDVLFHIVDPRQLDILEIQGGESDSRRAIKNIFYTPKVRNDMKELIDVIGAVKIVKEVRHGGNEIDLSLKYWDGSYLNGKYYEKYPGVKILDKFLKDMHMPVKETDTNFLRNILKKYSVPA